jgi:hypothetical protein
MKRLHVGDSKMVFGAAHTLLGAIDAARRMDKQAILSALIVDGGRCYQNFGGYMRGIIFRVPWLKARCSTYPGNTQKFGVLVLVGEIARLYLVRFKTNSGCFSMVQAFPFISAQLVLRR